MGNVKQNLEAAQQELQRLEQAKQALLRRFQSGRAKLQALIDHADAELGRLLNESLNENNKRLIAMNQCRKLAALANMDMVNLLQAQSLGQPFPSNMMEQLEQLHHRSQFCTMEFQMMNYQPILNQLVKALGNSEMEQPQPGNSSSVAQQSPAAGAGRPGTAPLRPTPPPVLGGPKAPPSMARPGMAARPLGGGLNKGAPALNKPVTGGLNRPGTAPLKAGTGMLARPGTGKLGGPSGGSLTEALKSCLAEPESKAKLQDLVAKLQDVEISLQPLRGLDPGELAVAPQEAGLVLRQIAGKMYYVNRALAALGPLGTMIPFEGLKPDPAVAELWSSVGADASAEPAEEGKAPSSLAGRLRSLFG